MSRSIRKPYAAFCGSNASAKSDKILAHRGVRRKQNLALRQAPDFEELLLPHRLECAWNEVWSWGRDGNQYLVAPPHRWRIYSWYPQRSPEQKADDLRYYARLQRK